MRIPKSALKIGLTALVIAAVVCLHYLTDPELKYRHAVYRMLFYIPLVLGSFWFGIRGSLSVFVTVSSLYLPYVIIHWQGFSFDDFNRLLEGALYCIIAFLLGFLVERERRKHSTLVQTCFSNRWAAVNVVDHGCGIEQKFHERVFEPFFSTKRGGAGLGLGIAKKNVEAQGGEISFKANKDKGVTFTVRLPLAKP